MKPVGSMLNPEKISKTCFVETIIAQLISMSIPFLTNQKPLITSDEDIEDNRNDFICIIILFFTILFEEIQFYRYYNINPNIIPKRIILTNIIIWVSLTLTLFLYLAHSLKKFFFLFFLRIFLNAIT